MDTPQTNGTLKQGANALTPGAVKLPPDAPPAPSPQDLAARAAEIKKRGAEIKASKDAINKERAALLIEQKAVEAAKAEIKRVKDFHATATQDPGKFLTGIYGEQYQDVLAKFQTGDKSALELAQLKQELASLRAAAEAKAAPPDPAAEKAKADDAARAEVERQFQDYRADTAKRFGTGGELAAEFPGIAAAGAGSLIADEIRRMHEAGKIDGDTDIAAMEKQIASGKEAELDKLLESVLALPKWQAKVKPTPAVKKSEAPLPFQVRPKALSQQMQAVAGQEPKKPLTRDQRRNLLAGLPDSEWNKRVDAARGLRIPAEGE